MSRLNQELKNMKRTLILDKAEEMFEEHGFEELKVSDLAHEAGVSVGTIYAYFESKEGLFSACVGVQIEAVYEVFMRLFEEELPFEQLIERSQQIKFDMMSKKRKTLESGIINNPFFFESQQISHKEGIDRIHRLFVDTIDRHKKVDVDTLQLVYILNAIGNAYVLRWIEGEFDDLNAKTKEVSTLFISMLKGA
ncbi:helix-turn-helix domain-containing protein [Sulfurimonas sp. HSL3-7]|uniref:TetR/AcrR family transcriptional regulator n=1 Tax=Sulfonitrofixus jiaomeiensis TaxID=3131938 RepID=UPI0031F80ECF